MLVDNAGATQLMGAGVREFGDECGSGRRKTFEGKES